MFLIDSNKTIKLETGEHIAHINERGQLEPIDTVKLDARLERNIRAWLSDWVTDGVRQGWYHPPKNIQRFLGISL